MTWPFMPHERRQVYDGGGDGGGGGGDGGGHEGGHAEGGQIDAGGFDGGGYGGDGGYTMDGGYTGDTSVSVGDTGTPAADTGPVGGFDPGGHEAVHAGDGGGITAGDVTGPSGGGGGAAVDTGGVVDTGGHEAVHAGDGGVTAGDTTGTGGGGGLVDTGGGGALPGGTTDTGIPGDVQPAGSGPQPGLDAVSDAYTSSMAGPYAGAVSTGTFDTPSFTDIVSQIGAPTSIGFGDPFGDPFISDDEDTQAPLSDYDVVTSPLAGALPGAPVSVAQVPPGVFPENWMTMTPTVMTSTPAAVAAPVGTGIAVTRGGVPIVGPGTGSPTPGRGSSQPTPDDTPMTGLSPELAASLATPPDTPAPTTPDPVAAPAGATADPAAATPAGGMVDITPETAEGPVTTAVNPLSNILRGVFQGAGSAIGGPVAGLINQDPLAVAGGLGVPGLSEVASLASRLRGLAGMTGVTGDPRGASGPPGERSQPGAFRTLWQLLNGTLPSQVTVPPVGVQGRPSIPGFFNFDNDRFPLGVAPAAVDETYDIGQLLLPGQPPRGRAQLLTPAERRRFGMEVAEPGPGMPGSSAGGNEATGYIDDLLTAIGLEPTSSVGPVTGGGGTTTPDTTPTPEQLPFGVDYFSGEATNWSPFIHGQRTAFDPRFFLGHGSRR